MRVRTHIRMLIYRETICREKLSLCAKLWKAVYMSTRNNIFCDQLHQSNRWILVFPLVDHAYKKL